MKINLPLIEPPRYLAGQIFEAIKTEQLILTRKRFLLAYVGFSVSLLALILAGLIHGKKIIESDFWAFGSLLFSDTAVVFGHLREFGYSLIETIPYLSILIFVLPIYIMMISFESMINNLSKRRLI